MKVPHSTYFSWMQQWSMKEASRAKSQTNVLYRIHRIWLWMYGNIIYCLRPLLCKINGKHAWLLLLLSPFGRKGGVSKFCLNWIVSDQEYFQMLWNDLRQRGGDLCWEATLQTYSYSLTSPKAAWKSTVSDLMGDHSHPQPKYSFTYVQTNINRWGWGLLPHACTSSPSPWDSPWTTCVLPQVLLHGLNNVNAFLLHLAGGEQGSDFYVAGTGEQATVQREAQFNVNGSAHFLAPGPAHNLHAGSRNLPARECSPLPGKGPPSIKNQMKRNRIIYIFI